MYSVDARSNWGSFEVEETLNGCTRFVVLPFKDS